MFDSGPGGGPIPGHDDGHGSSSVGRGDSPNRTETVGARDTESKAGAAVPACHGEHQRSHAALLAVLAEADQPGALTKGPFRSAALWYAARTGQSHAACGREVALARVLFVDVPELGAAYREGRINLQQVNRLVRLWRNRKLRDQFLRDLHLLLGSAHLAWPDFLVLVDAWEQLADPDPPGSAERSFRRRGFKYSHTPGGTTVIEITSPTAVAAQVVEFVTAMADGLFERDWADLKAAVGEDATIEQLPRNRTQRMHDAFIILMRSGYGQQDPGVVPTLNLVIDFETFVAQATAADQSKPVDQPEPAESETLRSVTLAERVARFRSGTLSGIPINPADVLSYGLAGRVRLFVANATTQTVEVNRAARLFTGALRDAIIIRDRHCTTPGCGIAATRCEIDHDIPHHRGGPTTLANGSARCRACHRHKTRLETLGLWPGP